ncbi:MULTISPECIES: hypothetical protein [Trichocoleus]|uniref:Uncharacterized protein n=1 Tax=Trichocoleus desertorum GB2-A4 TaxID=2933944 RepID=A0ABV0JDZ0_9CYAN|nr:hypothetical protein [Trichocoleus sp. FACHB-46]MBD1864165.1 hypothetical protein [Trichocoleus sp. FACHB-46]
MALDLEAAITSVMRAEQQRIQQAIADFATQVKHDLHGPDSIAINGIINLFDELKMEGIWLADDAKPAVKLEADGQIWILTRPYSRGYKIRKEQYKPIHEDDLSDECLGQGLLLLIGREREKQAKQQQEQYETQKRQELERASQERQQSEYQRVLELEKNQLGAVDQRIRVQIDRKVNEAQQKLWQWPQGKVLVLYKVEWFNGGYRDKDGESCFSYASGWSLSDRVDNDGYLKLLPEKQFQHPGEPAAYKDERCIRLVPEVNFPVFERRELRSVDDLPDCFTENAYLQIDEIWEVLAMDGTPYLFDGPGRGDGFVVRQIGEVPIAWIRESLVPANSLLQAR